MSIEDIGDPIIPLQKQIWIGTPSTEWNVSEKYEMNNNQKKNIFSFNGRFHWCQKIGNRSVKYRMRLVGKQKFQNQSISSGPSDNIMKEETPRYFAFITRIMSNRLI